MLVDWLREAAATAGADVDSALLGEDAQTLILELARDAAHSVARPAAPLAAFAVGLAIGRSGGGLQELREAVAAVSAAALSRAETQETGV